MGIKSYRALLWQRRWITVKEYAFSILISPLLYFGFLILFIPTILLIIPEIWLLQWLLALSTWLQIIIIIILAPALIFINAFLLIGLPILIAKTIQKKIPDKYAAVRRFFS